MPIIQHKFIHHQVSPETEILILGTFNPDIPAGPNFFYGRPRNFLWQLLPGSLGLASLKYSPLPAKQAFMAAHKIDFADLIAAVDVPPGEEDNVDDAFIDGLVHQWKDVIALIDNLPKLRAVYFSRQTFQRIPNIHAQTLTVQNHCNQHNIRFCLLTSPARFANDAKQFQWINTIVDQNTCLEP